MMPSFSPEQDAALKSVSEWLKARPGNGNTPLRAMRIADDIWQAARKRASAEGTTVTAVVVAFLRRYGAKPTTRASRK